MEIISKPEMKTVRVWNVTFSDGSATALTLEEDDTWSDKDGWLTIVIAPRLETRFTYTDRRGKEQTVSIAAQPEKCFQWNRQHIREIVFQTAEVALHAYRAHADDSSDPRRTA